MGSRISENAYLLMKMRRSGWLAKAMKWATMPMKQPVIFQVTLTVAGVRFLDNTLR